MKTFFILVSVLVVLFIAAPNKVNAQTLAVKKQFVSKLITMGRLTKAEVKECGGANKAIGYLEGIDLNKDGKPEFIADLTCQMEAIYVLRKTAGGVDIIFEGSQRMDIKPLKTYTKGWRNLRLSAYSAGTGESSSEILRWNGSEYK